MVDQQHDRFEFAMGEFKAEFPTDRSYAKNHMWASPIQTDRWRFGLTAYAVRLLQDVYFLDWLVEPTSPVEHRGHIGSIESKKAESDLFAPLTGDLVAINDDVLADPSIINADCYGEGWMIEIVATAPSSNVLISPQQYADHLIKAWDVAQKTIKGQANT